MNTKQAHTFVWQISALLADDSNYESKLMPKLQQLQKYLKTNALNKKELKTQHKELWKTKLMLESQMSRILCLLDEQKNKS